MKSLISFLILSCFIVTANAQAKPDLSKADPSKEIQVAEVSCGECNFHLKGKSCDMAVRINGKAYFVKGANMDSFGDAHAKDGFCKAIRKAEVQGEVIQNYFKLTYIKLLPQTK